MALHIVLVEPEIPPNTGNIARSCAATGTTLHLVEPLGFSIDDKTLKRAGLDYWQYVKIKRYSSMDAFIEENHGRNFYLATTKGEKIYTDIEYKDEDMIIFGKETSGLPRDFIEHYKEKAVRIPMSADTRLRSLNLAHSVNIILFEALRQLSFPNLL